MKVWERQSLHKTHTSFRAPGLQKPPSLSVTLLSLLLSPAPSSLSPVSAQHAALISNPSLPLPGRLAFSSYLHSPAEPHHSRQFI